MTSYREEFVRLLYGIILAQFIVIAILLAGFSSEYLSSIYFRICVDTNLPQLGLLLTGQVDALLVGMALGATILLIQQMKNGARMNEGTAAILAQAGSLTQTPERLPNRAAPTRKSEVATETPEQVLGELEKQDF